MSNETEEFYLPYRFTKLIDERTSAIRHATDADVHLVTSKLQHDLLELIAEDKRING